MDVENESPPAVWSRGALARQAIFITAVIISIAAAIVRSNIATGLDSFTFDEAYHIGAGAAYVQTGDFRLNPEHPPLVKLWVGAYVTMHGYTISPYRAFADKSDERDFVETDAYVNNDPFVLQAEARAAMFALNGLLMLAFAFATRRVFGDVVAIAAVLFLAIDPTVAAHMPVVMTDLPIALTSGIAVLLCARAFRTWTVADLILAALGVGLALSAKHSGIVTLFAVALIGMVSAIFYTRGAAARQRLKRVAAAVAVPVGGLIILWGFYGFHYYETRGSAEETFNRTLADKIIDVRSPVYRAGLNAITATHVFPRAYIWGLADTIRAGAEGRAIPVRAFGKFYYAKAPFYFFPGIVAVKLPLGLLILSIAGFGLLLFHKVPIEFYMPFFVIAGFSTIFLAVLMSGSSYAGVRHAFPLFPLAAILGSFAVYVAVRSRSLPMCAGVSLLFIAAIVSGVPQMRPWEYFNELAGGSERGYLYFNDEGVDLSQRVAEMSNFYHSELEPNGDVPFLSYFSNSSDRRARGMDWVGKDPARDDGKFGGDTISGTIIIGATELTERTWWDVGKPFRGTEPIARFGNVFVFRGTFARPVAMRARSLFGRGLYGKILVSEPDVPAGIELLRQSVELDPTAFFVSLELGNQYLKLGNRDGALQAYRTAYEYAPKSDSIYELLGEQVKWLESEPLESIPTLRNPGVE